jgi:hypothetical protein
MTENLTPRQAPVQSGTGTPGGQTPSIIPIEDLINRYPIDREKVRDVLLLEISKSLGKIAASFEKFFNEAESSIPEDPKEGTSDGENI